MKSSKNLKRILPIIFVLFISVFLFYPWNKADKFTSESKLKALHTRGNQIIQDDGTPIVLKGAVSDYFRYSMFSEPLDLLTELKNLDTLSKAGANVIGLYLSIFPMIKENIVQLDAYINYANDSGMYVYLAPVGHNFRETQTKINKHKYYLHPEDTTDLTQLTEFLANRYKNKPGVLYQPAAEPDISEREWFAKQNQLIKLIRAHSQNLIIISTATYGHPYLSLPLSRDEKNIVYQAGGYMRDNDSDINHMSVDEIINKGINLSQKYPVLVGEFGGNTQTDFSSEKDLQTLKEILDGIKNSNVSFTVYRTGPNFENDKLSIFDGQGNLTKKGILVLDYLGN